MKLITFSLWGSDESFFKGALENVALAKVYYPGWDCLFFIDAACPQNWGAKLIEAGAFVKWKLVIKSPWEGLFWRFEPISSEIVSHTIVRDCDSRLNPREAAAVNAWLTSGKYFHSMRDHYQHNMPIMGGMFGSVHWREFGELLMACSRRSEKGDDQIFLAESVWPKARHFTLAHDCYAKGLTMPNAGGGGTYEYRPLEQLGEHEIAFFPEHEPLDPKIHGEHVGARVA